jgi:hypothetical protein
MRKLARLPLILALVWATPLTAQSSREALIQEGRTEFAHSAAMGKYLSAMDPDVGEPDSLWAVAGFELADRLIQLERESLARVWLRYLARHGSQWPIDRAYYDPSLIEMYDAAIDAVEATRDEAPTVTTWHWPDAFEPDATGRVEARLSGQDVALTLTVDEGSETSSAEELQLPPGTYTFVASAEGYESTRFVREVLPGVTTVLRADLLPVLSTAVRDSVANSLVRVISIVDGREICRNGVFTRGNGLVLTTLSALRGTDSLRVAAFDDQELFSDVPLVASDTARDLAILKIDPNRSSTPLRPSESVGPEYSWAVHYDGCGDLTTSRIRLASWLGSTLQRGSSDPSLPLTALGAPLVDQRGRLLGLVSDSTSLVPYSSATQIVANAQQRSLEPAREQLQAQLSPGGGGFPWKWVGAGVAAVGVAAAATQIAGGGGGGGSGSPPQPTTGGIVITFPGGG